MVEKQCRTSCRVPVIVAQQPPETISTHDRTALMASLWLWSNKLIAKALRIPLGMIMGQVVRSTAFEVALFIKPPALPGVSDFS
jgi:hypothetical protein